MLRIARLAGHQDPVTERDRQFVHARIAAAPGERFGPALQQIEELPIPDSRPAFGRYQDSNLPIVLVDASENIWVLEYDLPDSEPELWNVFNPAGLFLGTVGFPISFSPLDIGDDYVLGVWLGEDDIEHVRMYGLTKSP